MLAVHLVTRYGKRRLQRCLRGSGFRTSAFLVSGDSFHSLRFPVVSGVEMKIYERLLQAPTSFPAPCTRVSFRVLL